MSSRLFETHMKVSKRSKRLTPFADPVQINLIPLRDLKTSTRNARTHSKKQVNQIANSMVAFGWTCPILIDKHGNIIAGVGRYLAAPQLGLKKVPVIVICGLSDAEQRALALADNKIAANSGWDRAVVAAELGELATLLPECDLDLEITGFEPAEVDALVADFGGSERDPADEIPTIEPIAVSRPDDVWALGDHRLVCGDAANDIHAGALMGRERAAMVFADPPYNLQVASVVGRGKIKHLEFASASGEMSRDEFTIFLKNTFSLAGHYSREGSVHYVCIDWRHLTEILAAGEEIYELKNLVVWVKTNAGQGSFYRSQHELIMVFKNGDGPHQNNIELGRHGRSRSNVWTYGGVNSFRAGRLDELSIHPTVKPVALVADAMRDCSRRGDIVLDPSGVTGSWSWPMAFPMMAEPFQAFLKSPSRSLGPSGMGLASLGCGFLQQSRKDVEQPMSAEIRKILRCAIYTRKSTEHGLELEFNSLDAQRDACEAYIKSQASQGWKALPQHYDDPAYSGGNLDRPALKKLLRDIEAGRIDVVVVYKIDRLTRSLADFAKLVEAFDARSISFVAVTQQFNTTTSMGRLTLNVLLSFAQFERELSSERVRDKIAASRRKGKWTGGTVPLGYDAKDKKLVINKAEAETVRTIFQRYVELQSFGKLVADLDRRGIVTKRRNTKVAKHNGGIPFTYGPLAHFLKNRIYLGEVHHGGKWFPGEHDAIVDRATFDRVQQLLATKSNGRKAKRSESGALLAGKLYDDKGNRMSPSFSTKNGVRYRFYVSSALLRGRKAEAGSVGRVPAAEIESAVFAALKAQQQKVASDSASVTVGALERIVVARDQLRITTAGTGDGDRTTQEIRVAWATKTRDPAAKVEANAVTDGAHNEGLIQSLVRAHAWRSFTFFEARSMNL